MKKFIYSLFICSSAFVGSLNALEFGYMGNQAFGMGGSGVGVAHSPFSAYYNPALQSVDKGFKIGYSLGVRLKENNLSELSKIPLSSIADINALNNILQDNSMTMTSENGVALQIPIFLGPSLSSSIGIGLFYTKRGSVNFTGNITSGTDINSATNAYIITNGLDIVELPLSYAIRISSAVGHFHIGASAKYIFAQHSLVSEKFSDNTVISDSITKAFSASGGVSTNTYGIDIGLAYSLPLDVFVIGVVGKNLNSPDINTSGIDGLKLDSQYRLGISTKVIPMTTIALDVDLKPNIEFKGLGNGMPKDKVQYVSLGGMFNAGIFDFRLGVAKNILKGDEGWLISGGLGFTFIDISIFSNTNLVKINNVKMPSEFGVKIGGGFSF
ncbi:hypothetical protein CCY99_05320 [Helicobacter sp. 16-1353]|uniref:conjugal transfer protein TraF n=1 Tax=Helicobacter sp. 16-1353 TaxID=2004996 RepID=UPI000DCB20BA|nr:conjugal transfer protein TraF [Helicobacter sp. 16-1353]RAX54100.1 hypothetical protein CCY99_05320 [Helicobacter sp. 16-1353]